MHSDGFFIIGWIGAVLTCVGLAVFLWRHAKTNPVQLSLCPALFDALILTALPILNLGWLVHRNLVTNRYLSNDGTDIASMVPYLFFLNIFCFFPVWFRSESGNPLQCKHVPLFLTATFALTASLSMIQEGRVRDGYELNYKISSVPVVGWEAINDTYSAIWVEFPGDNCKGQVEIVTNCTWFDESLEPSKVADDVYDDDWNPEHYGWLSYSGSQNEREFTCSGGPEYSGDDGDTSDWPMAYNIDGNTFSCTANWRLAESHSGDPYGLDERYSPGAYLGWAVVCALLSLMEYYGWEEVSTLGATDDGEDRASPFLSNAVLS